MVKNRFSFPEFSDKIVLQDFHHPLTKKPTKNTFTQKQNVILFAGSSMSGKSTTLKAVGLCIYFGHLGIGVPAKMASMPYFDNVFISLSIRDNTLQAYSHFLAEIKNLEDIVLSAKSGQKCFALFDELFKGTSIDDAPEISRLTVLGLKNMAHCVFLMSTRLLTLKDSIMESDVGFFYLSAKVDCGTPSFTYERLGGWSDLKIGRVLFKGEGLSDLLSDRNS